MAHAALKDLLPSHDILVIDQFVESKGSQVLSRAVEQNLAWIPLSSRISTREE
jgi:hypothetical protein